MKRWIRNRAMVFALLALAACAGRIPRPVDGPGAIAPEAAVDRFLRLAGERSYMQMGWVFGTTEGPIIQRYPLSEVERRMYALAHVLQHSGYVVGSGSPVPGRVGAAVHFQVQLRRSERTYQVPFTTVRGPDGRWLVEQVGVEAVTNVR